MKLTYVGIATTFALSASIAAASDECKMQSIYFGNGVWVPTPEMAGKSLKLLKENLKLSMSTPELDATDFKVAYNHSASKISDVLESARQILGNEWPSLLMAYLLHLENVPASAIPDSVKTKLDALLTNEAVKQLVSGPLSVADVADHVRQYGSDIDSGRKVVVVSHSQGNLFVHLAYDQLTPAQKAGLAVVPVASPDSVPVHALANPDHVTFINDLVIAAVQVARLGAGLPSALSLNDLAQHQQTLSAHEFAENYLTDESANSTIVNGVLQSLAALPATRVLQCQLPFKPYLPAALVGRSATASLCGSPATDYLGGGTISIADDTGRFEGKGCFAADRFPLPPAGSIYRFVSSRTSATPGGPVLGLLKSLSVGGATIRDGSVTVTEVAGHTTSIRTRSIGPGSQEGLSQNIVTFDVAERMAGWIKYISGKKCTLGFPGRWDYNNSSVNVDSGGNLTVTAGGATVASVPLSQVLAGDPLDIDYNENWRNVLGTTMLSATGSFGLHSTSLNSVSVTKYDVTGSNDNFQFHWVTPDQSGRLADLYCTR